MSIFFANSDLLQWQVRAFVFLFFAGFFFGGGVLLLLLFFSVAIKTATVPPKSDTRTLF